MPFGTVQDAIIGCFVGWFGLWGLIIAGCYVRDWFYGRELMTEDERYAEWIQSLRSQS